MKQIKSKFYSFEPKPRTSVKNVKERKGRNRLLVYGQVKYREWWQSILCKDGSINRVQHFQKQ